MRSSSSKKLLALGALCFVAACGRPAASSHRMGPEAARERARADSAKYPYTKADVDFMSGMIHHHAQAIVMSRLAPSRGASPAVIRLTERIINAQTDEILSMQTWLRDRAHPAPVVDSAGNVTIPGDEHAAHTGHALMPGMLTPEQMAKLEAARGEEFDQHFLTYMIQHHRGAITMVKTLYATPGSGQEETIFKFASDVEVDQSTEIARMFEMLYTSPTSPQRSPE
jgi:uncharacterized protein (DUF305 family)